jgi:predicted transcriptional regulator
MSEEAQREVMQKSEGNGRKVRALIREAGGDAPALVSASKRKAPEAAEDAGPETPLTERQRASRELDAKVRNLWQSGGSSNVEIARELGVSESGVSLSLRRQGLVKKAHPIQSIEKRVRELAEDFESFMGQSELYLHGASEEDRELCTKSLRALQGAVSKAINWLKKEAKGDKP